jgi:hypothetical protein
MEPAGEQPALPKLLWYHSVQLTNRPQEKLPNFVVAKKLLQASFLIYDNPGDKFIREEAKRYSVEGKDLVSLLKQLSRVESPMQRLASTLLTLRHIVCFCALH